MSTNKPKLTILKPRRIEAVLRMRSLSGKKVVVAKLARPDTEPRPAA